MAYIGKSIESGTFSVLDTSGNTYNGSNTAFNLGTQVGSVAQLLVSHDGVIQKPGTDYTLSSGGAAITFTTAPASGASIFIVEISGAVGGPLDSDLNGTELILDADGDTSITADTDDQIDIKIAGADDFQFTANTFTAQSGSTIAAQALTATTVVGSGAAQFATAGIGAAKDLGVGLHVKSADSSASANAAADELVIEGSANSGISILSGNTSAGRIYFSDNGDDDIGQIRYNHDDNSMNFKVNALADSLKIDSAGHVTKPLQPAVLYSGNNENNFTGDGTNLRIGIDSGVGTTEVFDVNADQTTGTFTAPVTGKYLIAGQMWIEGIASDHDNLLITMATSNRSYYVALDIHELGRASASSIGMPFCAFADMDANDTHILSVSVSGGSKVIDLVDLTKIGITLLS